MNKLSIIIPVWNKVNFTVSTLRDLSFLAPDKHEIIIVDNGSTDDTEEKIKELNISNLIYIKNETNLGFGTACNIGYSKSSGNIIMFLNNDIRVKKQKDNWTDIVFENVNNDVICGPAGGKVKETNFDFMYETSDPNKPINYISGWCIWTNKETWNKLILPTEIGPFDASSYFLYYEDTDIGQFAIKLGMKLQIIDVPLIHFARVSSSTFNGLKHFNQSKKVFTKKWAKK